MQTGCTPGAACCGCNQHNPNYLLFSETTQAPMPRVYDLYVAGVLNGGIENNRDTSKKNNS